MTRKQLSGKRQPASSIVAVAGKAINWLAPMPTAPSRRWGWCIGRTRLCSPVTGAKVIMGLIPCNVIPEEILTDHPNRFRATFIETSISVHSLADSQRMREVLRALDISVGIDVARIETARQVDYVLPATCQFEKAEATFFKVEFPRNGFHLRQPLFPSHPGTLTEAEISAPTARRLQGAE